jgi:hypothetical protein
VHASHTPIGRPATAAHVRHEKTPPVTPATPCAAAGVERAYEQRESATASSAASSDATISAAVNVCSSSMSRAALVTVEEGRPRSVRRGE